METGPIVRSRAFVAAGIRHPRASGRKQGSILPQWSRYCLTRSTDEWCGGSRSRVGVSVPVVQHQSNLAVLDFETGESSNVALISPEIASHFDTCPIVRTPGGMRMSGADCRNPSPVLCWPAAQTAHAYRDSRRGRRVLAPVARQVSSFRSNVRVHCEAGSTCLPVADESFRRVGVTSRPKRSTPPPSE